MADQEKALDALVKTLDYFISCQKILHEFMNTQGQINEHVFNRLRALENEKNALKTSSPFHQVHAVLDAALPININSRIDKGESND